MTFFYPEYDKKQALYWVVWSFVLLYVIGTGVYLGFFVHNVNFIHTWFSNPGSPGDMLVSFRGTFTSAAVRISVFSHVLSIFFLMALLAYRKSYGCNILWFILYIVCFLLTLVGLGALSGSYAHCNGQNQYGNICNDRLYCCPPEIHNNVANRCPNTLPCDPPKTLEDLNPNSDFLGLYWLNFILFVMQMVFIGMTIWVIYYKPKKQEEEEEEEEEEEKMEYPPSVPTTQKRITRSMASHGLKRRN